MGIRSERISLALKNLSAYDGFEFENFANSYIASEFPNLRPVGGVHDGGRDAFIYQSEDQADVFVQNSVTAHWESKITSTISTLKKTGLSLQIFHSGGLIN